MDDQTVGLARRRIATPSRFQMRGARGILDWSMHNLAKSAHVSVSTIKRMETAGSPSVSDEAWVAVRKAFEAAGVRFLVDDDGGQGIWLVRL